jgi:type I restriction enzyme S subunit
MMKHYDSYKDSGIEWIGEIPKHWNKIKVGYISKLLTGNPWSSDKFDYDKGIKIVRGENVSEGFLRWGERTRYWIEQVEDDSNFYLTDGDIIIGMDGSKVGKNYVRIKKNDLPLLLHQRMCRVRVNDSNDSKFVEYWIGSDIFKYYIDISKTDPMIPHITQKNIFDFCVTLPPLSEQEHIVSYLDDKTTKINELIQKKKRKIELLKEYRTSLINTVVTKGLNPDVPMKDSGIDWIGEIPSHWNTVKLKQRGEVVIGLSYSPENIVEEGDGVLVMRSSNVQNGKPSFTDNVYVNSDIPNRMRLLEGDILICSRNGSRNLIGKNCLITKNEVGMAFGVFMTVYRSIFNRLIYWILNSPVFESQSGLYLTSTINQLTVYTLQNMTIPFVDDHDEQEHIVSYLDEKTSQIDKTIDIEKKKIQLLKEYRQSLISNVVTGKIKVVSE